MKGLLLCSLTCLTLVLGVSASNILPEDEASCLNTAFDASAFLNTAQLGASYAGLGPDMGDEPGYDTYQVIGATWITGAQNWTWQFTDGSGNVSTYTSGGINNTLYLQAASPDLCYGETYDVQVDVMIGGVWCGFGPVVQIIMEDEPHTKLQSSYCGNTYGLYTSVQAVYVGNAQEYNWKFVTDNGATEFQYNAGASQSLFLDDIPEMRYNKIYEVWVQVKVCDTWGSFNESCLLQTAPLPYTWLEPEYCNMEYASVAEFTWVPGATEYWAKVYLTDPDDPNFLPLGPAQLYNVTNVALPVIPLYTMGLQSGNVYAVQVKPYVGEQQGDYGPVCLVFYGVPVTVAGGDNYSFSAFPDLTSALQVWPNPNNGMEITVDVSGIDSEYRILVMDGSGQRLINNTYEPGNAVENLSFNGQLSAGIYHVALMTAQETRQCKFIVH
ncbi:MAG: T9SS type A sorting domain-containing protein [Flavobacteriales bacterium]|nr:T9SS type A sorting domain-containing protein [Flavobacteriales bacterium]